MLERTGGIYRGSEDVDEDAWEAREAMNDEVDEAWLTDPSVTADMSYKIIFPEMATRLSYIWKPSEDPSSEGNASSSDAYTL